MLKRRLVISLLVCSLVLSLFAFLVLPASASSGTIKVNSRYVSAPNQQIQAGGNVNLYFGSVSWSGNTFYLAVSHDNYERLSTGDSIYTPQFLVSDLTGSLTKTVTSDNGVWQLGGNWINGTLVQNIPVGNYTIKGFDQASSTVAVTDVFIIVYSVVYSATLQASPAYGTGGIPVQFSGAGYPPSSEVTISYLDPAFRSWNYFTSTMADAQGHISFTSQIPDLRAALGPGDYPESYKSISFRSEIHGVVYCYFDYNQYSRGLKAVGTQIATGLYGNGTNLSSSVNVKIGDNLALSGRWFHPGVIYIRFDGSPIVGTVTGDQWRNAQILGTTIANSAGSFDVSVPIPTASTGKHYLSIEDSETRVIVSIYVSYASLSISPSSGPGGSTVQFTGSGYPANQPVTLSYYDSFFGRWSAIGDLTADASGQIRYGTQIPDLRKSASSGDSIETYNTISFRTEKQDTIYGCTTYNEYVRGLKTVGALTANGLYGNGTNIPLSVNAGDSILVSGRWFYPGVVYVRWDGKAVVGTVTGDEWRSASIIGTSIASSTGSFDLTVTVPSADSGVHYISIEDAQTRVIIRITVLGFNTTTPTPTPINRAPTNIDLSCESTASYIGYKVEINGTFSSTGAPVSGEPVQLSYSDTGGSTWSSLTQVYTDSNGCFSALWMPQISGNYLIRASYLGSETLNSTTTIVTLVSTPYSNQNVFSVTSNSTVSALAFNSANNELSFVVSGASATFGYVEVAIAKSLVADVTNIQVYLDDEPTEFTVSSAADAWILHFEYTHSTHSVTVNLAQTSSPTASSRPTNIPSATPPQTIAPTDTPTSPQPTYTPTIPELSTVAIALAIALMLIVTVSFKRWQKTTKQ